jgi:hypothetical protein
MNKRSSNGGSLQEINNLKFSNLKDTYENNFGIQQNDITEEIFQITQALRGDTQGFLGKVFKEFQPVAYKFSQSGDKFKIKVKTERDCLHLIGSRSNTFEYELTYATDGNSILEDL